MRKLVYILLLLLPLATMGQTKKSEPLFEQAVEKGAVGQYEEAIALLQKAIKIDPTYTEAYLLLGNQYVQLGNEQLLDGKQQAMLEQYARAQEGSRPIR